MLNKKFDSDTNSIDSDLNTAKPNTPVCEVINCGEDSVDTEYSGSTINMEVNKSLALFEEDPKEIDRIDNMRQLLKNSTIHRENVQEALSDTDANDIPTLNNKSKENLNPTQPEKHEVDTFNCSECGKAIQISLVEMHADYHLALKLRDEERQLVRKEIRENKLTQQDKTRKKPPDEHKRLNGNKNKEKFSEQNTRNDRSITNFFEKLDGTVPTKTCSECGKKISLDKFSEHLDFHEAQKLNKALNSKPAIPLIGTHKRKRKSVSPVNKLKVPNCKSIDSFFK